MLACCIQYLLLDHSRKKNEHQAVHVHGSRGDDLMDAMQHGLPGQVVLVPVELQPVGEALGLPASPNKLHDGEEPLMAAALLPYAPA